MTVVNDTAYFCAVDRLAAFSNKRLNIIDSLTCDRETMFQSNSSGVFFSTQEGVFRLNTDTLSASLITPLSERIESMCSTADSLVFIANDSEAGVGNQQLRSLFSYSTASGLQQIDNMTFGDNVACLSDKVIVSLQNSFRVYNRDDNNLDRIRGLSTRDDGFLTFSPTNRLGSRSFFRRFFNAHIISGDNNIYATRFRFIGNDDMDIVKVSLQPAPTFSIAPIINELLEE